MSKKAVDFIRNNMHNREFKFGMQMSQLRAARQQFKDDPAMKPKLDEIESKIRAEFADLEAV
jgi:hypothetical protein